MVSAKLLRRPCKEPRSQSSIRRQETGRASADISGIQTITTKTTISTSGDPNSSVQPNEGNLAQPTPALKNNQHSKIPSASKSMRVTFAPLDRSNATSATAFPVPPSDLLLRQHFAAVPHAAVPAAGTALPWDAAFQAASSKSKHQQFCSIIHRVPQMMTNNDLCGINAAAATESFSSAMDGVESFLTQQQAQNIASNPAKRTFEVEAKFVPNKKCCVKEAVPVPSANYDGSGGATFPVVTPLDQLPVLEPCGHHHPAFELIPKEENSPEPLTSVSDVLFQAQATMTPFEDGKDDNMVETTSASSAQVAAYLADYTLAGQQLANAGPQLEAQNVHGNPANQTDTSLLESGHLMDNLDQDTVLPLYSPFFEDSWRLFSDAELLADKFLRAAIKNKEADLQKKQGEGTSVKFQKQDKNQGSAKGQCDSSHAGPGLEFLRNARGHAWQLFSTTQLEAEESFLANTSDAEIVQEAAPAEISLGRRDLTNFARTLTLVKAAEIDADEEQVKV